MRWGLWLLALCAARAAEPLPAAPARPALEAEVVAQLAADGSRCVVAVDLLAGEAAPCRGVLVPAVELLEAQLLIDHLGVVEGRYALDLLAERHRAELAQAELEMGRAELAGRRWVERPAVAWGAGVLVGAGLTVGVAWALPETGGR